MRFVCIRTCILNNQLCKKGIIVEAPEKPNKHFEPLKKAKAEESVKEDEQANKLKELRAELDALKKPYDKRWGIKKLEHELLKAKKLGAKANNTNK